MMTLAAVLLQADPNADILKDVSDIISDIGNKSWIALGVAVVGLALALLKKYNVIGSAPVAAPQPVPAPVDTKAADDLMAGKHE